MRKIALLTITAILFAFNSFAGAEQILGCWTNKVKEVEHVYFTRDNRFVYTKVNESGATETWKGEWKFKKAVGTLELMFDDRPAVKLIMKSTDNVNYFVDRNATIKLFFTDIKNCQ